ncbi:MAG: cation diffusion facilitator family transporter [Acidimicrobiia bacterium]|nr:cation diffusion facilitator family transporter [Acidimicrobiia bacterium]
MRDFLHRLRHLVSHDHDHGTPAVSIMESGSIGIRASQVSLIGLGVTALIQGVIVVFSGSVALLSDTLHNLTDALTAIPLWIAFAWGRKAETRTYTYGFRRAEDFAGLLIVGAIGASAVLVVWQSIERLIDPRLMDNIPWVIAAGVVGAAGNELVARYRIATGRRIGSEALIADGHHARSDAWTSLAVVAAGIGATFEAAWVDPVAGLVVAAGIVVLMARSARRISRRLLDGVEPAVLTRVESPIGGVEGVEELTDLRARWHGHQLRVAASISVDPTITVARGHDIAHAVEHALHHEFTTPVHVVIHVEPHGQTEAHDTTAHHKESARTTNEPS